MRRLGEIGAHLIVMLLLGTILIDGLPVGWPIHRLVKDRIDPVLDRTGLWQQGWKLFAPEPDRVNVKVFARVAFEDGSEQTWTHPDWSGLNAREHMRYFRQAEYFDSIRLDKNRAAWDAFAAYVAREVTHVDDPNIAIRTVVLNRSWMEIQPPSNDRRQWLETTNYKTGVFEFHTWSPGPGTRKEKSL